MTRLIAVPAALCFAGVWSCYAQPATVCNVSNSQTNGYVLTATTTGGNNCAWRAGGGVPGGSNTQVQFKDGGVFGGNAGFTFDKTTGNVAIGATVLKPGGPGVINVRLQYGAVPDGSTDNSTAIANAFTNANAFTTGTPTVYFDCDTNGQTTCQYNYGGSGTSPINPTRTTTILCAPGVSINYTGSAHALDIGLSGRTSVPDDQPYRIEGCTFTGGASYTQGIYINPFTTETKIIDNFFYNFGNRTGFNIYYAGNNWEGDVNGNWWLDDDGTTRNILDGHNASVNAIRVVGNTVECYNGGDACPVTSGTGAGVGFWVAQAAIVEGNTIQYHVPLLRFQQGVAGDSPLIVNNYFEINQGMVVPMISYGTPGGAATGITCQAFTGNTFHGIPASGSPVIGPETPASGSYVLNHCLFAENNWSVSVTTRYVDENSGSDNVWGLGNYNGNTRITIASSSPAVFRTNTNNLFVGGLSQGGIGATLPGKIAMFQPNGQDLTGASYHHISAPLFCSGTGTSTAQSCLPSPPYDFSNNYYIAPVAGDMIIFQPSVDNTGDLTLTFENVASHIKNYATGAVLTGGESKGGIPNLLVFDGTYWWGHF